MPSLAPQKQLPGIFIKQVLPEVAATVVAPASTEVLIGAQRTVIRAEQGILGGPVFSTLAPRLSEQTSQWIFRASLGATPLAATINILFGSTEIRFVGVAASTINDFVINLRASLLGSSATGAYVKDVYAATDAAAGFKKITIVLSENGIAAGYMPSLKFVLVSGTASVTNAAAAAITTGGFLPITEEAVTAVSLPALNSNWVSIENRRVIEEVVYGLDASRQGVTFSELERFYFDMTARMDTALRAYLGKSTQQKAYYGDMVYVADASTLTAAPAPITVSKPVLGGTQRVTAISVRTGVEYELRLGFDYTVPIARVAGAYILGDVVTFNAIPTAPTFSAFGTDPILIRLVYVPDRYVAPLPVLNYKQLVPSVSDVLLPAPLDKFTFDPAGGGEVDIEHVAPPAAARFPYTRVGNIVKLVGTLVSDLNLAPRLNKVVPLSVISGSDVTVSLDQFGTPNIDAASIVITRADGVVLVSGVGGTDDYLYTASTNSILFRVLGVNQPTGITSNPLSLRYAYSPQVTYVGDTSVTVSTSSTGLNGFTPAVAHLGGGLHQATTPGFVAAVTINDALGGGAGYTTAPDVTIAAPTTAGGVTATATAVISIVSGKVTAINVTNAGSGYVAVPAVTLVGGGFTTAATAVALVGPAAMGELSSVVMTYGGTTYTTAPTIGFVGGGGAGAAAVAFISGGAVISVQLTNRGTGYTSAPAVTFTGGGFTVVATAVALFSTGVIGNAIMNAIVEYPLQPEVQLEFFADRDDLDGQLLSFTAATEMTAMAALSDTYAGETILPDLTVSNPTLHAAAMALSVSPSFPVQVGIGKFETGRIENVMTLLRSQPNSYWLVPITQDSAAALAYVGGHVDLMVATIEGTQIHYAPGGFRVMCTTLDQRNEVQLVPAAVDTLFGTGFLVNDVAGGVAVQANLTGATGSLASVQPGHFIEFYQADSASEDALIGSTVVERPIPKRLLITAVDTSILSQCKFSVSDDTLPPVLDPAGPADTTHAIKLGAPFRIINVRSDVALGGQIGETIETLGAASNGERRWIHQPDIVVINDLDGTTKVVPGFYKPVLTEAVRAASPPHQGMTNQVIPRLAGVHRGSGFYDNDDAINLMTDGGADYAVQRIPGGPVISLQELTSNRLNQFTQSPIVIQVVDFVSARLKTNTSVYIGRANVYDGIFPVLTTVVEATIRQLKGETFPLLGPILQDGRIIRMERLPITAVNAGVLIEIGITVPQELTEIKFVVFVDTPQV